MTKGFDEDTLDAFLAEPLSPIADNGFTNHIKMKLEEKKRQRKYILGGAFFVATSCLVAAFPASVFVLDNLIADPALVLVAVAVALLPLVPLAFIADDM